MLLADSQMTEYLTISGTESNAAIDVSIVATAGNAYGVRAVRCKYDTDPDGSGANNALETITYSPADQNDTGAQLSEAPTATFVVTIASVTDATNSARFSVPTEQEGTFYFNLARRSTSLPKTVPMTALVATSTTVSGSVEVYTQRKVQCVTTGLTSGSLMHKDVDAIAAASPFFEEYATELLERFYKPL